MRNSTLLDRQNELLRFLTNSEVIFGEADFARARDDLFIGMFDISMLRLEAEMSFEKRVSSIQRVLPRTFALLSPLKRSMLQTFAKLCPPRSFQRYINASDFVHFLEKHANPRTRRQGVLDVARIELALAKANSWREPQSGEPDCLSARQCPCSGWFARSELGLG